jgi:hypothetical protein
VEKQERRTGKRAAYLAIVGAELGDGLGIEVWGWGHALLAS